MAELKKGAISLVVTLILLFGSFFTYKWFYIERSISALATSSPYVELKAIAVKPQLITVRISIPQKSLVYYPRFYEAVRQKAGNRKVNLDLVDHPNAYLLKTWNEVAFGVKEGIAQKRYTLVQKSVEKIATKQKVDYEVLMDDSMICITLRQGEHYLYKVFNI